MSRSELRKTLNLYGISWATGTLPYPNLDKFQECDTLDQFSDFVESSDLCFERHYEPGHITGSALITTPKLNEVLLIHHKKLNKWLQLGGHADGCTSPFQVALKEAEEESGLSSLYSPNFRADLNIMSLESPDLAFPLDIDIHEIPARGAEKSHFHYDIRYLLIANPSECVSMNEEANDLRWFKLDEAYQVTNEASMTRQFDKLSYLQSQLLSSCI